jgi:hypothetical protein
MNETTSFKRLTLRAVLHQVSPVVIRLLSVPDQMELPEFHRAMRLVPGRKSDVGYIVRVHGQEFSSFRRKAQSKALHELNGHPGIQALEAGWGVHHHSLPQAERWHRSC